jgi:hypothetical protein
MIGIRNLSLQLHNFADNQIDYGVTDWKSCGTAIADLQNLTSATLRSLLPIPLFSSPFSSAQYGLKINQKYF